MQMQARTMRGELNRPYPHAMQFRLTNVSPDQSHGSSEHNVPVTGPLSMGMAFHDALKDLTSQGVIGGLHAQDLAIVLVGEADRLMNGDNPQWSAPMDQQSFMG